MKQINSKITYISDPKVNKVTSVLAIAEYYLGSYSTTSCSPNMQPLLIVAISLLIHF